MDRARERVTWLRDDDKIIEKPLPLPDSNGYDFSFNDLMITKIIIIITGFTEEKKVGNEHKFKTIKLYFSRFSFLLIVPLDMG